jgi:nicotinamide-nucleotide amidase
MTGANPEHLSLAELVRSVHSLLHSLGQTVAVAESLTGGLLSAALTETPGASESFRGGIVAYATELKASVVGVAEDLLAERGAVDPAVAEALARGARERLGADWGLGITGVAGPDPQDGKSVGTVYIAIVGPPTLQAPEVVGELSLSGSRNMIRSQSVEHAVGLLRGAIAEAMAARTGSVE